LSTALGIVVEKRYDWKEGCRCADVKKRIGLCDVNVCVMRSCEAGYEFGFEYCCGYMWMEMRMETRMWTVGAKCRFYAPTRGSHLNNLRLVQRKVYVLTAFE
jgi:hypothetical protein